MSKYIEFVILGCIVGLVIVLIASFFGGLSRGAPTPQYTALYGNWICTKYETVNRVQGKLILPVQDCVQYTKGS